MNSEIDEKTINSNLVVPFIAIICFMLVIIGTTYAYYLGSQINEANNIANVNLNMPSACSFNTVTTGNCDLTSTDTGVNFTDNIISSEEMTNTYDGNAVAQSTCGLNVIVSGANGCSCNYTLELKNSSSSSAYVPTSSSLEYTARITSSGVNSLNIDETNISSISLSNTEKTLTVSNNNQEAHDNYSMTVKWYNLSQSQASHANKEYSYKLVAKATGCNGETYPDTRMCWNYSCQYNTTSYGQSYDTGCTPSYPTCKSQYFSGSGKTVYYCFGRDITSSYPTEVECARQFESRVWFDGRCYEDQYKDDKYSPCVPNSAHSGSGYYEWYSSNRLTTIQPVRYPGWINVILSSTSELPTCNSEISLELSDYYVCPNEAYIKYVCGENNNYDDTWLNCNETPERCCTYAPDNCYIDLTEAQTKFYSSAEELESEIVCNPSNYGQTRYVRIDNT